MGGSRGFPPLCEHKLVATAVAAVVAAPFQGHAGHSLLKIDKTEIPLRAIATTLCVYIIFSISNVLSAHLFWGLLSECQQVVEPVNSVCLASKRFFGSASRSPWFATFLVVS